MEPHFRTNNLAMATEDGVRWGERRSRDPRGGIEQNLGRVGLGPEPTPPFCRNEHSKRKKIGSTPPPIIISTHLHVSTAPSILLAPQSVMRQPGWQAIGQGEKRWPSYRPQGQEGILLEVIRENSTLLQAS